MNCNYKAEGRDGRSRMAGEGIEEGEGRQGMGREDRGEGKRRKG